MKLVFGDMETIEKLNRLGEYNKKREQSFKRSGLTKESFLAKEELRYWMNPTKPLTY